MESAIFALHLNNRSHVGITRIFTADQRIGKTQV